MRAPVSYRQDPKQAAIDQWTADPCGPDVDDAPGSAAYIRALLAGRAEYAPWMSEALGYSSASGLTVLDVGCGQGIDVVEYAMAGADVTGVDLTPRHVALAGAHLEALELPGAVLRGDAERLAFYDETFDCVTSNGVLHHTPDMPAALQQIYRVLRRGGEASIILYNRLSFVFWLNHVLVQGVIRGKLFRERSMSGVLSTFLEQSSVGARPLVRTYTPRRVRQLMRAAGFAEVTTTLRHFQAADTAVTKALQGRVRALRDPRFLDRIGRVGGWYVIARGVRPVGELTRASM